jgi:hypothetical protein
MDRNTGRFVAVNLTDAEWYALRKITPDPSAWMKSQIQRLLVESGVAPVSTEPEPSEWDLLTSPTL